MQAKKLSERIQVGQVWREDRTGEPFLVTQLYTEALATFVVLRKAGAETERRLRVRVERSARGQTIPGFSYSLDSDDV